MNAAEQLPLWAAWLIVGLAVAGATLSLIGALGLARMRSFYERVHGPTLGTTLGALLIVCASIAYFSIAEGRPVLRDLLVGLFLTLTTPVTMILLARAAVHRDRSEGDPSAPKAP